MAVQPTPEIIEAVGKALHVYHGRGYCSEGRHDPRASYKCWEEARVVIGAINGHTPAEYPDLGENPMTLAAREAGKREQERAARLRARKAKGDADA